MKAWPAPVQSPPSPAPVCRVRVHDTASRRPSGRRPPVRSARLYVCGITPYDATHLGHAATYVTFDLLQPGLARQPATHVHYVQNVTDVDDPLLERAARDGVDWRDLAEREIALFREDMTALAVIAARRLRRRGRGHPADRRDRRAAGRRRRGLPRRRTRRATGGGGRLLRLSQPSPASARCRGWTREQMLEVFAERGGDPDRPGKRDPLDRLLWRAAPAGRAVLGRRPLGAGPARLAHRVHRDRAATTSGMALRRPGRRHRPGLPAPRDERVAGAASLTGEWPFARAYVHPAMVGLDGEKMTKSRGNLVLVSRAARATASTRWRSGSRCWPHHYRTRLGLDRRGPGSSAQDAPRALAGGAVGQRPDRPPSATMAARARVRSPTTSTPRPRSPRSTAGPREQLTAAATRRGAPAWSAHRRRAARRRL